MEFIEIEEKVWVIEEKLFEYERNFNGTKSDRNEIKVILDRLRYGLEVNDDSEEIVAPNNPPEYLKRFIQVPKENFYTKQKQVIMKQNHLKYKLNVYQIHTTKIDREGGTLIVSAETSCDNDGKKSLKLSGFWDRPDRIECGIKFGKDKGSFFNVHIQGRVTKEVPFK